MDKKKKIAVIGLGKLGESLVQALLDARVVGRSQVMATTAHPQMLTINTGGLDVRDIKDNAAIARAADIIILSVKPQIMAEALRSIRGAVTPRKLVISTAAGVTLKLIEQGLGKNVPVIRTMPNTPCLVRCGMTAISPGKHARREHVALAQEIFNAAGRSLVLEEKYMDAVTGLSGSGPAFMYVVLEALAEGGLKVGLARSTATELIAQTMLGSAKLILETGEHPAKLKEVVTTPAGCTIDGLLELEEGGLRVALIKAVVRATRRASELQKE